MDRVRKIVHADYAHKAGYIGRGVTVAIMDTGIGAHPDLNGRVLTFIDFTQRRTAAYDDNGHGTHIAGIVGGSGFLSRGRYTGMAPGCNFVVLKVLDRNGNGNTSQVLEAMDWLLKNKEKYQIRILNISVGMLLTAREQERQQLEAAVEEVWNHNIAVVAAAGNNGPARGSITVPGMCRSVITVGSSDDEVRGGAAGLVRGYSGRGPTQTCVVKPEVTAPGTAIVSCALTSPFYEAKSGTSMATPVVSGALAVLLSKEAGLQPAQMKLRLYETSIDQGRDRNIQGWGQIDVAELL